VWNLRDMSVQFLSRLRPPGDEYSTSLGFDHSGTWLVASGYLWKRDRAGFSVAATLRKGDKHVFSPDGRWLAVDNTETIRLIRLDNLQNGRSEETLLAQQTKSWTHRETILTSGRSGQWLVHYGGRDDTIRLWRIMEGGVKGPFQISLGGNE